MNADKDVMPIRQDEYQLLLNHAVDVIENTRMSVAKQINANVSSAYWQIGQLLHDKKIESGYGDGIVKQLSVDLKERYPKMGVSPRNLWDMKKFYERFKCSDIKLRQAVAVLPWGHILRLIQKIGSDDAEMLYYAQKSVAKGWSRDLLLNAIKMNMYQAAGHVRLLDFV